MPHLYKCENLLCIVNTECPPLYARVWERERERGGGQSVRVYCSCSTTARLLDRDGGSPPRQSSSVVRLPSEPCYCKKMASYFIFLFTLLFVVGVTSGFWDARVGATQIPYITDWGMVGGRSIHNTCVDIPRNMTLCHEIGYKKMRLPNLLDHDTIAEISQQAVSWIPLLNVKCHPDTQLFLCSLFSPVCLDRPIYPCRSLCYKVKAGCEGRMQTYGYPWPDMFNCERFPMDNDMCITSQAKSDSVKGETSWRLGLCKCI